MRAKNFSPGLRPTEISLFTFTYPIAIMVLFDCYYCVPLSEHLLFLFGKRCFVFDYCVNELFFLKFSMMGGCIFEVGLLFFRTIIRRFPAWKMLFSILGNAFFYA